jgi:hypothetical protein
MFLNPDTCWKDTTEAAAQPRPRFEWSDNFENQKDKYLLMRNKLGHPVNLETDHNTESQPDTACMGITPMEAWDHRASIFHWCYVTFRENSSEYFSKYCYETNRTMYRQSAKQVKKTKQRKK